MVVPMLPIFGIRHDRQKQTQRDVYEVYARVLRSFLVFVSVSASTTATVCFQRPEPGLQKTQY